MQKSLLVTVKIIKKEKVNWVVFVNVEVVLVIHMLSKIHLKVITKSLARGGDIHYIVCLSIYKSVSHEEA